MIVQFIDSATKVMHLILAAIFIVIIWNSLWNWVFDIINNRKSVPNNQVKTKSTQMD
jgi:uncharacterized membrane protein